MQKIIILIFIVYFIFPSESCGQPTHIFVFLNNKTDKPELPKDELEKLMQGHLANIQRLAKEGKLIIAGPFEGGGGIFVLNTTSIEEANDWLSTDPGIAANRWRIELLPVKFIQGSVCSAADSAEMVTYSFVRFIAHITKFNVKTSTHTIEEHEKFINDNSFDILAEGSFPDRAGSILIIRGDVEVSEIEKSPAVVSSLFQVETKKLWIAEGSFCEK